MLESATKLHAGDDIGQAFAQLDVSEKPSETLIAAREAYVCKLYLPLSQNKIII